MSSTQKIQRYDVVLLGDMGVGKSSLLMRLVNDKFCEAYESTIGVEFGTKVIYLEQTVVSFSIWDTAGQEKYDCIAPIYYRKADAAIIMFDVTKYATFDRARRWMDEVRVNCQKRDVVSTSLDVVITLVGNKVDIEEDKRMVKMRQAQSFAMNNRIEFMETSAKTAKNVENLFVEIAKKLVQVSVPVPINTAVQVTQKTTKQKTSTKSNDCC